MLSEENMRVTEHKKHASAIQKRIQQLEEQIASADGGSLFRYSFFLTGFAN